MKFHLVSYHKNHPRLMGRVLNGKNNIKTKFFKFKIHKTFRGYLTEI